MAKRREDPMGDLLLLQQRMNRLFEESLRPEAGSGGGGSWSPVADLWENPEAFVLELDLPGVETGDLEVTIGPREVTVRGRRRGLGGAPETFQCLERSYGHFARRFGLTAAVDAEAARREMGDGVLRLEIPKKAGPGA